MTLFSNLKQNDTTYSTLKNKTTTTRMDRAPTLNYMGRGRDRKLYPVGDILYCDGFPVRTVGVVDYTNLRYLQLHGAINYIEDLRRMSELGIKFVKTPTGPTDAKGLLQTYYSSEDGKKLYLENIKRYLDWANYNGIGVVITLLWDYQALPDITGETIVQAYGSTSGVLPNSQTVIKAAEFITTIVNTFRDHPSLSGWEFGQEYNDIWDLGLLPIVDVANRGTRSSYSAPNDIFYKQAGIALTTWAGERIRANDPSNRIIITGNNIGTRVSSTEELLEQRIWEINPQPYNTLGLSKYTAGFGNRTSDDVKSFYTHCRRASKHVFDTTGREMPFIVRETGATIADYTTIQYNYNGIYSTESFRRNVEGLFESGVQLGFVWGWNNKDYLNTPYDSEFYPSTYYIPLQTLPSTYVEKSEILRKTIERMRNEPQAYVDPFILDVDMPWIHAQTGAVNPAIDTEIRVMSCNLNNEDLHSSGQGFTIEAWIYIDEVPTQEAIIIQKYVYSSNGLPSAG